MQEQELKFYQGQDLTFITPSGNEVTIREQNADDDEILSKVNPDKREETLSNLNNFLTSIVRENDYNGGKHLTLSEVKKLKLRDKYYILLKSRLHSVGDKLKFTAICPNKQCKTETNFSEDLTKYDTDLSQFKEENKRYKYQVVPYQSKNEAKVEFVISTGKKIRYTYLTVEAEEKLSKSETISENTDFYIRNLEIENPQTKEYQMLGSLSIFSKREIMEIGKHVQENDKQFEMFMEMECPKCGRKWEIPFLYLKDFFFPGEI